MLYVVFKPSAQVAYCRKEYPMTPDQLFTKLRCNEWEYWHDKNVSVDMTYFMEFGGFKDLRIAIDPDPAAERIFPYTKFHTYKDNDALKYWLDTTPHAKLYPITSEEEYQKEKQYYKEHYGKRK